MSAAPSPADPEPADSESADFEPADFEPADFEPAELRPVAVVSGASSGIGAATARHLVDAGFAVVLGARRTDRLATLCEDLAPHASFAHLDVTDPASVAAFCEAIPTVHVLINNAGGALGREPIVDADEDKWRVMYETNVLGVMRMTRALLPKLVASGNGHVVTVGSVAAFEAYVGGAGYIAAKHAARGVSDVLRLELVGQPVRVSEVDPGMVETEFSLVRFDGDADAAAAVYKGMTPLVADDIAEVVTFVVTRPAHVDIDQIVIRPRDQARTWLVHRRP